MKGESTTAFEAALQDAQTNEIGEEQAITTADVESALNAVATSVFPHQVLEIQRLWV